MLVECIPEGGNIYIYTNTVLVECMPEGGNILLRPLQDGVGGYEPAHLRREVHTVLR